MTAFRIACLVGVNTPMIREVFAVLAAHKQRRHWSVLWLTDRNAAATALHHETCDVLITSGTPPPEPWRHSARWTIRLGMLGPDADYRIATDQQAVANQTLAHLRQRHIRSIAMLGAGPRTAGAAGARRAALKAQVNDLPLVCAPQDLERSQQIGGRIAELATWLSTLPQPVGVIGNTVADANTGLIACQQAGLAVPEQARIVAMADHEPMSLLSTPAISACVIHARGIGRTLAELLDQLAAGSPPAWRHRLVPPLGMMPRASSGSVACGDPAIDQLLAQARSWPSSAQLADELGISIRQLQRRVQAHGGQSLASLRTDRVMGEARSQLRATQVSIARISTDLGYANQAAFSRAFAKVHGMPPQRWREQAVTVLS